MNLLPTSTSRYGGPRLLRPAFLALCWIAGSHLLPGETAAAQGICDRTPQVRDEILNQVQIEQLQRGLTDLTFDCAEVNADHLALVRSLWLVRDNITAFQAHDFRGLVSLDDITVAGNPLLTTLPEGIFQGLSRLENVLLSENSLTTLPDGLFRGLGELRSLNMDENSLTAFPEDTFRGLDNLVRLDFSNNLLTELPESIFHGLGRLVTLDSSYNALEALPENIYRGLVSLEILFLSRNRLQELPEGIFRDLKALRVLWMGQNSLSELPPGIFRGLRSLESLALERNSLRELPKGLFEGLDSLNDLDLFHNHVHYHNLPAGIFDDVLDTLGGDYHISNKHIRRFGSLNTGGSTRLAVDSPGQQAPEGATVRVGVSLNGPSPVAIRVPYTIGLGRGLGGLEGFSPSPERGLLFRAGETRREIAFTVPEQAGSQGPRRVVLTLGKTSEIGIRRSDGRGPDAPYLDSGDVVWRRDEGAVHAVTISDSDPDGRQPFCFSLWGGARCWTAAVLPHAVAGLLRGSVARTELALTNRDPGAGGCEAGPAVRTGDGAGRGGLVRRALPRGKPSPHDRPERRRPDPDPGGSRGGRGTNRGGPPLHPLSLQHRVPQGRGTHPDGAPGERRDRGAGVPAQPVAPGVAGRRRLPAVDRGLRQWPRPGAVRGDRRARPPRSARHDPRLAGLRPDRKIPARPAPPRDQRRPAGPFAGAVEPAPGHRSLPQHSRRRAAPSAWP